MNFNETFEKYKWGKVTDEEKEFVEQELKKYEAIRAYLDDEDGQNQESDDEKYGQQDKKFHLITKVFCGAMATVLVGVCTLGAHVYNKKIAPVYRQYTERETTEEATTKKAYWDYTRSSIIEGITDLEIGLDFYYKLHMFGLDTPYIHQIEYIDESEGKFFYSITKYTESHEETNIVGIEKGGYLSDIVQDVAPFWGYSEEDAADMISNIPDEEEKIAYITLKKDLTQQEILDLLNNKKKSMCISWLAIRNDEFEITSVVYPLIGISPYESAFYLNSSYPMINLQESKLSEFNNRYTAELLVGNLSAMMEFQRDHPEILEFLGQSYLTQTNFYGKTQAYLAENELASYGFVARGTGKELRELCKGMELQVVWFAE